MNQLNTRKGRQFSLISWVCQAFFLFLSVSVFTACHKDMSCPNGFSGNNCSIDQRMNIVGKYHAVDKDDDDEYDSYEYFPVINAGGDASKISISFFGSAIGGPNDFAGANVTFDGDSLSFVIPSQVFASDLQLTGFGNYSLSSGELIIHYTFKNITSGAVHSFTGKWEKK